MNFRRPHLLHLRRLLCACTLSVPLLAACAKPTLPVNIHGVNYSAEAFSFVLQDPADPKNTGHGELVDSYAAGGTTCCYVLPKKWKPGMKVSIQSKHWLGKTADHSLRDVASEHVVDIPRYADGKPGELWVLRAADGTMDIVSSDFQPDHPKWPGKVKGWPVPSLAYQRERWDISINHEKGGVRMYEKLLAELAAQPDVHFKEAWDYALAHDKKSLEGHKAPTDASYRSMLKGEYEEELLRTRIHLEQLERERP